MMSGMELYMHVRCIDQLTVCEPISAAMASMLEAHLQLLQDCVVDQRGRVQYERLGLLVLQLSWLLDTANASIWAVV